MAGASSSGLSIATTVMLLGLRLATSPRPPPMTSNPTEATREGVVPVYVATAPERIYLQISDDESHADQEFPCGYDVTWCSDSVLALEVEYVRADITLQEADALRSEVSRLRAVVDSAVRAMGDHNAPNDCYATGPLTGDPYRDLVECPACSFIKLHAQLKDPTP